MSHINLVEHDIDLASTFSKAYIKHSEKTKRENFLNHFLLLT